MGKNHIKRISAPKTWPITRKSTKWITRPNLGSQSLKRTISLNTIIKEMLNLVVTSKEVKVILNKGLVKVDGVIRKEVDYPVCVLDVVTIKDDNYRLLINTHGKLYLHKIKKEDALIKPRKIIGKKILKGNKIQVNFLDGHNKISTDKKLMVSDTVVYDGEKEKETLRFEKGAIVYVLEGKQVGKIGMIKDIIPHEGVHPTKVSLQLGKEDFATLKSYVIIVGKTKPIIDIPNE